MYWFRKFEHSSSQFPAVLKNLYVWWDRFAIPGKSSSIITDALKNEEVEISGPLSSLYIEIFDKGDTLAKADESLKGNIKAYRKEMFDREILADNKIDVHQKPW